eukprot:2626812-Rhodomonas_salina.1
MEYLQQLHSLLPPISAAESAQKIKAKQQGPNKRCRAQRQKCGRRDFNGLDLQLAGALLECSWVFSLDNIAPMPLHASYT